MEKLRLKILLFLLGFSCLPVLVLLLSVIIYAEATGNSLGDYTAVLLVSGLLIAVGGIVSLVLTRYAIGKAGQVLKSLRDVFSLSEFDALKRGSSGEVFSLIVNSFEYYREKRIESSDTERELKIVSALRSCTQSITFHKAKDAVLFVVSAPAYWKKTYPHFDIPEKALLFDYLHEEGVSQAKLVFSRAEESEEREFSLRSMFKTGQKNSENEWTQVLIIGKSVLTADGEIVLVGIISDEERHRRLEAATEEYRNMYRFALASTQDLLYEVDVQSDRITVEDSAKWGKMFGAGLLDSAFSVSRERYWERIDSDYREGFLDRFLSYDHLALFPNGSIDYEYRIKNAGGEYIWVSHVVYAAGTDNTDPRRVKVTRVIGRITDINEQTYRRIRESSQAQRDALTGAFHKSTLKDEYNRVITEDDSLRPSLIVFDINGFGLINDLHGRIVGDRILQAVVNIIWENQVANCKVARTGGDEFTMLSGDGSARLIAQRVLEKFNKSFDIEGTLVNVTISVGAAYRGTGGESFDDVYGAAVKAMNNAAAEGANKFSEYIAG